MTSSACARFSCDSSVPADGREELQSNINLQACPYYGAREMMLNADIIFCPYNYLVDPFIRDQMDISLKDEIVVLDEAHNIEDSAREAASVSITSLQLEDVMVELDRLVACRVMIEEHGEMNELCCTIVNWLESLSDSLVPSGFETSCKIFTGREMIERLRLLGITSSTLPKYKNIMSKISEEHDTDRSIDVEVPTLSAKGTTVLRILVTALGNVLDNRAKFSEDYKIAVSRKAAFTRRTENTIGTWRNKSSGPTKTWVYSLNFWCLNPAVVFAELGNTARCIVLTSGTLSPMSSFSSELGVTFPIRLEANHVIPDSQVWVGALTVGTNNQKIKANYHNSETFFFQDEVGKVVLQTCQTVPRGVLCFFPSYSMLEKLKKRWQITDIWDRISNVKMIYSEPRGSDRAELDTILDGFYKVAKDESTTGALLLAVCRGKVSEGMDFTDDNARAVITIGVPFPDFRDKQVELKREYNNKHSSARGLLTGSEWYEIQAYRALNQALGRCIRHRRDWGAILLLDERFGLGKYKDGLSRWVRTRCKTFSNFALCLASLKQFADARMADPCPEDCKDPCQMKLKPPLATSKDTITSATNDCSLIGIKTEKHHSAPEKTLLRQDPLSHRCNSIKTSDDATAVRPDVNGTPFLKKEKIEPKQLSSQMIRTCENDTLKHKIPDQKAKGCGDYSATIDGKFCGLSSVSFNRSKLFKAAQSKVGTSPTKPCGNAVVTQVDKAFSRTNEIIDIEDDEVIGDSCKISDTVDECLDDCSESLEMDGKRRRKRASKLEDTPKNENCSQKSKAETPLLFSDKTVEIGSFEDAFWDSTDFEMSEVVRKKFLDKGQSKPESCVTVKEETKSGQGKRGLTKEDPAKEAEKQEELNCEMVGLKSHSDIADKVGANVKHTEFDSALSVFESGDVSDSGISGVAEKSESNLIVKRTKPRKKAKTRMAKKYDAIDDIDANPTVRSNKATVMCKHCFTTLANQAELTHRHMDGSSVSELMELPGKVVHMLEASSWPFNSTSPLRSFTSKTNDIVADVKLNAFFCEEKAAVYIPLVCTKCHMKSRERMLTGIRIINLKPATFSPEDCASQKDKVLLFPDHVVIDDEKDS